MPRKKRNQTPAQLANLTHNGAPRQRHGEAKTANVQARVTHTDKARFMAALEAAGLSSLLGLIEAVADGVVVLSKGGDCDRRAPDGMGVEGDLG